MNDDEDDNEYDSGEDGDNGKNNPVIIKHHSLFI